MRPTGLSSHRRRRWHTAMSSITASIPFPRATAERSAVSPWVIAITVTLATFMELLDTAIANVSLPHIAGGLGVSYDESTWVLTSYLVSNAVVLPLSAWLSRVFGRKRYYMLCVVLFTLSSLLFGLAHSLSRSAGCRGRRIGSRGAGYPRGHFPSSEAARSVCAVQHGHCHGSGNRPATRRVDYR